MSGKGGPTGRPFESGPSRVIRESGAIHPRVGPMNRVTQGRIHPHLGITPWITQNLGAAHGNERARVP